MSALQIARGVFVHHQGERYEIIRVLDLETVLARRAGSGEMQRLPVSGLSVLHEVDEPPGPAADLDTASVPDEDWQEAERRLELIRPLLERTVRGRMAVETHATTHGVHWTTLYKWARRYRRTGRTSTLLPHKPSGGRGRVRLDEETEAVLRAVVEQHYLSAERWGIRQVIIEVHRLCRNAHINLPHANTIRNRIKEISEYKKMERRMGKREAKDKLGGVGDPVPGADHPLAVVEIDHTPVDVLLVDEETRQPLGRPYLTLVIDVYSRVILGFYVSLDPPSATSVGIALVHAMLPKDGWLARRKIDVSWPFWGKPRMLIIDNAPEFHSRALERGCEEHGIAIQWRRLAHPKDGPYVERGLGRFAKEFHALPGTTFSNTAEKAGYDSEAKAVMTLAEFEQWFTILVAKTYHPQLHRGIGTTPRKRFEEGIFGTADRPGIGLPDRPVDEDRLRIDFLPVIERTIQRHHVQIDYMEYDADVLGPVRLARDPDNPARSRQFTFRRDPRDISVVYWYDPDGGRYHRVPTRNLSRPSISLWEWNAAIRHVKNAGREDIDEDLIWEGRNELRALEEASTKKTKAMRRAAERKRAHARSEKPVLASDVDGEAERDHSGSGPVGDKPSDFPDGEVILPFARDLLN